MRLYLKENNILKFLSKYTYTLYTWIDWKYVLRIELLQLKYINEAFFNSIIFALGTYIFFKYKIKNVKSMVKI